MDAIIIAGLIAACATDWKYRKIPNTLTFSLIVSGFISQCFANGMHGMTESLLGFSLGIALLYLPFVLGGVGGGDVKLLAAIGTFAGPAKLFEVFLVSALFGGIFSLIEMIRKKQGLKAFHGIKFRIFHLMAFQSLPRETTPTAEAESHLASIPYAIPLATGYLWISIFGGLLP